MNSWCSAYSLKWVVLKRDYDYDPAGGSMMPAALFCQGLFVIKCFCRLICRSTGLVLCPYVVVIADVEWWYTPHSNS